MIQDFTFFILGLFNFCVGMMYLWGIPPEWDIYIFYGGSILLLLLLTIFELIALVLMVKIVQGQILFRDVLMSFKHRLYKTINIKTFLFLIIFIASLFSLIYILASVPICYHKKIFGVLLAVPGLILLIAFISKFREKSFDINESGSDPSALAKIGEKL